MKISRVRYNETTENYLVNTHKARFILLWQ